MAHKLICIGASFGGLKAVTKLISLLPKHFLHPIVLVIHRTYFEHDFLVETLQKHTSLKVQEVLDKMPICLSTINVAPADYHLLIEDNRFALSTDFAVAYARPSIDVLMYSAADNYTTDTVGIILTGGGRDGVHGMKAIKDKCGLVYAQSPASSEDSFLPQSIVNANIVDTSYSIEDLAQEISRL